MKFTFRMKIKSSKFSQVLSLRIRLILEDANMIQDYKLSTWVPPVVNIN